MTFIRGKQAEIKDGWVNGHRVRTAHVRGTTVYTVKIDNRPEQTFYSGRSLARYLYEVTKQQRVEYE